MNANEVLKGIGSGSLLAPGSRWYATVQKAEEVHRMQSQLADIHAQNLGLKAQIEDMKIKQTAELERLKLKQNTLLARIKSQDLFSKTALGLKRKKLQSEIRALHAAEREARRDRADKQKAWVDEEAQRDVLWKWDLTKIIERGNTNADGTPKPNWMGLRGAQTRDHNVTEYKLTDHSPAWLHTFVRYAQKQVTAWFKRRNEALTGWYPGKSQFRRGGSFCSALGHMVKQSDGDDGTDHPPSTFARCNWFFSCVHTGLPYTDSPSDRKYSPRAALLHCSSPDSVRVPGGGEEHTFL